MASIIGVETLQHTNGTTAATIDSSGKVGFANTQKFKQADGTYIDRPHFEAVCEDLANQTQAHTTSDFTSFGSGGVAYFSPWTHVNGINTTGFNTSSSKGGAYYKVPVDGVYQFSFAVLLSGGTGLHIDTTYYISDKDDTVGDVNGLRPWSDQSTAFTSNTSHGVRGFSRLDTTNSQIPAVGNVSIIKLYEGQHVRPAVIINSSLSQNYIANGHSFWHGCLIG